MFLPGIYCIENRINEKQYIGSAVVVQKRWNIHKHHLENKKHHSVHLQRAYDKYGADAFRWFVLELVRDEKKLIEREQYYIDELKPEYNMCKTAGSRLGMKHTDEVKKKCAEAARNQIRTTESRLKQSQSISGENNHFFGKKHTKEACEIISDKNKEYQAIHGNAFKGKNHTKEAKAKMSIFRTGLKASEATRKKMSEGRTGEKNGMFGRNHDKKAIMKMSVPILQYDREGKFIKEWVSATEAVKCLGLSGTGNIATCAKGKLKTAYGYIWKYKN